MNDDIPRAAPYVGPPPRPSGAKRLRTYFLTGIIVAGPVAVTIWVISLLVNFIDGIVKPLIPDAYNPDTYLPFAIPGFGVVVAFLALTMLGFFTANILGRTIVTTGERLLDRLPIVRSLYKGAKQIFETVFKQDSTSFRRVGLIEWPHPGQWSIVFISEETRGELAANLPHTPHICCFMPTTPNPTTGFMVILPKDRVIELNMTPDEAFRMIMSMGIIQPEERPASVMIDGKPVALSHPPHALTPHE